MSNSSILGGTQAPTHADGTDVDRLGPSDRSDSGSDIQGEQTMATDPDNAGEWGAIPAHADSQSDAWGTGERSSAAGQPPRDGDDILPDRIIGGADDDANGDAIDADVQTALDALAGDQDAAPADDAQADIDNRSDRTDSATQPGRPGHPR